MKSFTQYVVSMDCLYENDEFQNNDQRIETANENSDCLNSVIELAVKKGYKNKTVDFLKSLGDEEINRELEDSEKGLGDVSGANNKENGPPDDEIVPSSVDNAGDQGDGGGEGE